jgi:hypothetical protein
MSPIRNKETTWLQQQEGKSMKLATLKDGRRDGRSLFCTIDCSMVRQGAGK